MADLEKQDKNVEKSVLVAGKINNYYQRFMRAEQAIIKKIALWRILDIYDRGDQWKDANIPPWIPKPVTNMIRYIRTIKRAHLAAEIPTTQVTPLEQQFVEPIERLQKAYQHVWKWGKVGRTVRWAIDRALLKGTSVAYVFDERNYVGGVYDADKKEGNRLYQGKICVKLWSIDRFFIDPDALCIEEAKFIDTPETMPLNTVKHNPAFREYCEKEGTLAKLDALTSDHLEHQDTADGRTLPRDYTPSNAAIADDKDYMATVHIHWERYLTKLGKYQLDVTYYLRNTDFYLLRIEDMKPNCYPFAALLDEQEEQQFHGTSTVMDLLENQRIINKTQQTYSIIATMHQNPQKVITRSSGISAQEVALTGTLPGKTWTTNDVDANKSIMWSVPPVIPQGLFEVDNAMKADIRETTGVSEAYTGQSVGSLTTSTGVRSLIDQASIRDRDKMKQIDAFVEDLSDIIRKMIMYKWTEKRTLPDRGADGKVTFSDYEPIEEKMADQLEWMSTCDTYAVAPSTEEARKIEAKELLDIQGKYGYTPAIITPQEFLKMSNYKDKELILERMQKDVELQQQQKKAQPPKLMPTGEIAFNVTSKDPQVIYDTMQQMLMNQVIADQSNLELTAQHLNNGLAVNPQQAEEAGTSQAQVDATAPSGSADAQAMGAMTAG
jgi:hypothetical protein